MSGKTQIIVERVKNESTSAIVKRLTKVGMLFPPCTVTNTEGNSMLHLVSEGFPRGWSVLEGYRFVWGEKSNSRITVKEGPVFGNKFHGRVKDIGKQKGFHRILLEEKALHITYNKLKYLKKLK